MSHFLENPPPDTRTRTRTGVAGTGCDNREVARFTEFDQGVSLLAVLHVGKVHLPALQALLLVAALVSTLELTWETTGVIAVNTQIENRPQIHCLAGYSM